MTHDVEENDRRCDIGSEAATRENVKVVRSVETMINGKNLVVKECFGIALVKDCSEREIVERGHSICKSEFIKSRVWHVNKYETRNMNRNFQKASVVIGKEKTSDLHTISRLACISFLDAAWAMEGRMPGLPMNKK